jgi:hypothetical protein
MNVQQLMDKLRNLPMDMRGAEVLFNHRGVCVNVDDLDIAEGSDEDPEVVLS